MGAIYFFLLLALFLIGIPVAFALGGTSILLTIIERGFSGFNPAFLGQKAAYGLNNFLLLAVPLFLYTGKVMNTGRITKDIFSFAKSIVGSLHGGLGHVNIVSSVIFAGMTGTATSDAAGLGAIELQAMKEAGYEPDFSVAVTGASSTLGPIIPPSLPLVIYGMMTSVSIGGLLVAGIIPGALMTLAMMIYVEYYAMRHNMPKEGKFSFKVLIKEFGKAFFALLTPVIIIGGILTGVFTPTEAAAVAALYATLLTLIRREISLKDLIPILKETLEDSGAILMIVCIAQVFGYMVTRSGVAADLANLIGSISTNPYVVSILLIIFLLIIGCFLEATAAITILAPTIMPILAASSIDPMHFGVIMVLTLMIGLLTPPFGIVLFILQRQSGLSQNRIVKATLPFLIPLLAVDILLVFFPGLVTWLPSLI